MRENAPGQRKSRTGDREKKRESVISGLILQPLDRLATATDQWPKGREAERESGD